VVLGVKNFPEKTIVLNATNIPEAMLSVHEFLALSPKDWEALLLRYSPTCWQIGMQFS
jgi:hypothetical protein